MPEFTSADAEELFDKLAGIKDGIPSNYRELSLARTKIDEAMLWLQAFIHMVKKDPLI
jgi:hypothetical protein